MMKRCDVPDEPEGTDYTITGDSTPTLKKENVVFMTDEDLQDPRAFTIPKPEEFDTAINLRMTKQDIFLLDREAEKHGVSRSEYLRYAIRFMLKEYPKKEGGK